jgi:hypothetical protein
MFEFIANAIDQFTIFFSAMVTFIKTLPTSANCVCTDYERGVVV